MSTWMLLLAMPTIVPSTRIEITNVAIRSTVCYDRLYQMSASGLASRAVVVAAAQLHVAAAMAVTVASMFVAVAVDLYKDEGSRPNRCSR